MTKRLHLAQALIHEISQMIKREKGAILIMVFVVMVALSGVAFAFLTMISQETKSAGTGLLNMQAFYIAEAGRAKARWALTTDGQTAGVWGESDTSLGEGTYNVTTVDNGDGTITITSDGYIPDDTSPLIMRRVLEKDITTVSGSSNNLALDAIASDSSTFGGNVAANANDDNSSTRWRSGVNGNSQLQLDFGSATEFDKVVFDERQFSSYAVQYSSNASTWNSVTGATTTVAGNVTTVTFDGVTVRYVRLDINGNRPSVYEFETYLTTATGIGLERGEFATSW